MRRGVQKPAHHYCVVELLIRSWGSSAGLTFTTCSRLGPWSASLPTRSSLLFTLCAWWHTPRTMFAASTTSAARHAARVHPPAAGRAQLACAGLGTPSALRTRHRRVQNSPDWLEHGCVLVILSLHPPALKGARALARRKRYKTEWRM